VDAGNRVPGACGGFRSRGAGGPAAGGGPFRRLEPDVRAGVDEAGVKSLPLGVHDDGVVRGLHVGADRFDDPVAKDDRAAFDDVSRRDDDLPAGQRVDARAVGPDVPRAAIAAMAAAASARAGARSLPVVRSPNEAFPLRGVRGTRRRFPLNERSMLAGAEGRGNRG